MIKALSALRPRWRLYATAGLLVTCLATAADAGLKEAEEAFNDENYEVAVTEADAAISTLSEAAQDGNADAYNGLAWAYYWRHSAQSALDNAPFDPTPWLCDAIKSWEQASIRDNTQAQSQLATLYLLGKSMPDSSPDRAYFWARVAIATRKKAGQSSTMGPEITVNMALPEIPRDRLAVIDEMVDEWLDASLDKRLRKSDEVAQCPVVIE